MTVQNKIDTLDTRARALCDDPVSFFDGSYTAMQSVARDELAQLQLEGLRYRFDTLRDRIPMLRKLADNETIETLDSLESVVPLLFEHTMYKAYPPALLENGRFTDINRFLSRLTAVDLSGVDVSQCQGIDDWMETMDRESPLTIMHSSGTSGTMSFIPYSKAEWDKMGRIVHVLWLQRFGEDPAVTYADPMWVIWPFFRQGGSSHVRMCDTFAKYFAGSEDRLLTAYSGRMSSDILYLAAKIRSAQNKGTLANLKISPRMLTRKDEYEKLQAEMPAHLTAFFADIAERLKGQRVFFWGGQNLLFNMAKMGAETGLSAVFAPNSVIGTGGDSKEGVKMPDDWRERVCDFAGIDEVRQCYGMSEIGAVHNLCSHRHYHFAPWVIPYVLDPETSALLPRSGKVTGRAAFFDLGAETRWGGFITGDEITIDWDTPCGCGQTTVWAEYDIQRLSQKQGGDDKISCAGTESAYKDAMSFLTTLG